MPSTHTSTKTRRPTVDEWGVYAPQQAGLAALFTRLSGPPEPRTGDMSGDNARSQTREAPAQQWRKMR